MDNKLDHIFVSIQNNLMADENKAKSFLNYLVQNNLYAEARDLQKKIVEKYPEQEVNLKTYAEGFMLSKVLGMVELGVKPQQAHLMCEVIKVYLEKGDQFDIRDAARLQSDNEKVFKPFK